MAKKKQTETTPQEAPPVGKTAAAPEAPPSVPALVWTKDEFGNVTKNVTVIYNHLKSQGKDPGRKEVLAFIKEHYDIEASEGSVGQIITKLKGNFGKGNGKKADPTTLARRALKLQVFAQKNGGINKVKAMITGAQTKMAAVQQRITEAEEELKGLEQSFSWTDDFGGVEGIAAALELVETLDK